MKIRNIVILMLALGLLTVGIAGAADRDKEAEERAIQEMAAAREALNREQYKVAAEAYAEIFEKIQHSQMAGNALYWQAFARYRMQNTQQLKLAAELLRMQQEKYGAVETAEEGEALLARLYAELAQRGEPDAAWQVSKMSDDEERREETRIYALRALMEMDPDRALPMISDIVTGKTEASREFRRNAVFLLCHESDGRGEKILIDLLRTTEDPELLSEVVMCLSMSESESALDALIDVFQSTDDPEVSESALFAIGRRGGERAFSVLEEVVRDKNADPEIRQHALFGLSHTGRDADVADIATEILSDESDRQMQEMALMALSRLEGPVPREAFLNLIRNPTADDELKAQALFFAVQHGDLDVPMLRDIYEHSEGSELKLQICHVLTQMDDDDAALDLLLEIAENEDDPEIRQNAVFWVGRFDNEKAADFLMRIINEN